ncbi:MAG: GMC oxidoreductase [Thiolinea sp.]
MDNYAHMAGMWLVGEDMPQESNRITLNTEVKDKFGQPVANVHFDDHPNDLAMREHAFTQGWRFAMVEPGNHRAALSSTHNLGTCRMSEKSAGRCLQQADS